ncbi:predicted protein [Plenodomus lingam JN3]|uniref:Predicted protein n=1 Tax=Leptosphaeria maculans (strain JN3 / isolate v23.1.3 / race Av1-4-5-6-7-8) TaxID=985895 RepID=E4ZMA5_LEPMJ|nr:predicted protein [Plenodomus lingam JN3]CBX92454.1 predicted protein [Plenodomus lingam JN3]
MPSVTCSASIWFTRFDFVRLFFKNKNNRVLSALVACLLPLSISAPRDRQGFAFLQAQLPEVHTTADWLANSACLHRHIPQLYDLVTAIPSLTIRDDAAKMSRVFRQLCYTNKITLGIPVAGENSFSLWESSADVCSYVKV